MANKNILITLGFVLLTTACGKVVGDMAGTSQVDQRQLQKATEQFCSTSQTLKELKNGANVPFGQLNYRSRVFAFIGKDASQECIIKNSVNETFQDGTWFSINPPNNCLKNGSIWVVNSQSSGQGQYYSMTLVDDPNQRIMNMNGHMSLNGSYVSENLGLTVLVCENK